jgi:hypothetical protein
MRLTHLAITAAVAGAMATPLTLAAPASATADGSASAFGIAASGLVKIPPTPAVSSSGKPSHKSLIELPANPLIAAGVLNADAWAGNSRASVVDVRLAKIGLTAEVISAKCENGAGVSHLTKVVVNGKQLAVSPAPNSGIAVDLAGIGQVGLTLNKQVRNPNGSLTVTAVEVNLGLGHGKLQTVSISSATCGGGSDEPSTPGTPTPTPPMGTPPGEAPAPTPVTGDLPVTG